MDRLHCPFAIVVVILLCAAEFPPAALADDKVTAAAAMPSAVGETAKDFTLETLDGKKTQLSALTKQGTVVLVVLRGYPGYQCPLCTKQVAEMRAEAKSFASAGARVVLVYPGPSAELKQRAKEFLKDVSLPSPLVLTLDPDYSFVKAYGVRWDAPQETAYPSTFVIDKNNKVVYSKVSKTHGGRAKTKEILAAVPK
jgi:peroxiredoxin